MSSSLAGGHSALPTTEPAFMSHQKYAAGARKPRNRLSKLLRYFCYSLANLALILFCLLGAFFTTRFLYDDTLYENAEHLLGLKFYRQLVFVIVVFTLLLLVPLFNAVGACFLTGGPKARGRELNKALVGVKIVHILVLAVLIFVCLALVAPSMRASGVAYQLNFEILRHLQRRYSSLSDFSLMLTDQLQERYKCCDELWYRANYPPGNLPTTCYANDGKYVRIHERNCSEVLGELVADRCIVIASCLIGCLVALVVLLCIIVAELVAPHHYYVDRRESILSSPVSGGQPASSSSPYALDDPQETEPLDQSPTRGAGNPLNASVYQPTTAPLITRAHFLYNRPQSPTYLPPKSSLKKAPSTQRLDSSCSEDERQSISSTSQHPGDHSAAPIQHIIGGQLTRDTQTRRSTLSVRFAE